MGPILLVVLLSCLSLVAASVFPSSLSCAASLEVVRRATTGCSVPRSGINLQGRLVVDLETAPALDSAVRPAVLRRAGYGHTVVNAHVSSGSKWPLGGRRNGYRAEPRGDRSLPERRTARDSLRHARRTRATRAPDVVRLGRRQGRHAHEPEEQKGRRRPPTPRGLVPRRVRRALLDAQGCADHRLVRGHRRSNGSPSVDGAYRAGEAALQGAAVPEGATVPSAEVLRAGPRRARHHPEVDDVLGLRQGEALRAGRR